MKTQSVTLKDLSVVARAMALANIGGGEDIGVKTSDLAAFVQEM